MITPEGDFLSNLEAPDLRPYFKHLHWRPMGHSFGHLVASDWADKAEDDPVFGLYKRCGLWTRDEAAILYNVARNAPAGDWLDIGCHTGWTSWYICKAHEPIFRGNYVHHLDPCLRRGTPTGDAFHDRVMENSPYGPKTIPGCPLGMTSNEFFSGERMFFINHGGEQRILKRDECTGEWIPGSFEWVDEIGFAAYCLDRPYFSGICIDGDHEPGKPLEDAKNSFAHLAETGVIILHDAIGAPVQEAVTWLMDQGMKARVFLTPHMIGLCWRGNFKPPDHEPDPKLLCLKDRCQDFDFTRCE